MGINYKYDIDTVGGGWYLFEMDIAPSYIAPLKPRVNGEGDWAWGIYDERGRMSDFRFTAWKWSPTFHGFADGYVLDETHDKYISGPSNKPMWGVEEYKMVDDHRWPCFCMDLQLVVGLSLLWDFGSYASLASGKEREDLYLGNTEYLSNIGFRFQLPDLETCIDYMKRNQIPREGYKDVVLRLIESREVKRQLGIEYGTLGWGYRGVVKYDERENTPTPLGKKLDNMVAAYEKMKRAGRTELRCEDLIGTMVDEDGRLIF